ncbi:hypothetical protein ACMYZ8_03970 [Bacteroides sp. KG156]|uniref:hypothetical protein n=1 Tax=unclassified Bacteroides TaxID=2646097 RepID=UPI003D97AF15
MKLYDFLFYASYKQGIKSRNYDDIPILGGILSVSFCLMMNFITLLVVIHRLFGINFFEFDKIGIIIFAIIWVALLYYYYNYKERHRRIIEKIERKKDYIRFYNMPYLLVIFMYIGIAISIFALFAYIIPL